MRLLVIAEKPKAARRVASALASETVKRAKAGGATVFSFARGGDEYTVLGLHGHVVDLDYPEELADWASVDLQRLMAAEPVRRVTDPELVETLRSVAPSQDTVVVATDFDREGELIGQEAVDIVHEVNPAAAVKRARFSALTKPDVESAFEHLSDLDVPLAAAARCRQVVDLAWGAVLTRFLTLAAGTKEVVSVGRVQSPTLALVDARERLVEEFLPVPEYRVVALLQAGDALETVHEVGVFSRRDEAEAAHALAGLASEARVVSVKTWTDEERPPPPFHTTALLAEAVAHGLSAARTMVLAEQLYMEGLISYPRTDNAVYPPTLGLRAILERLKDSDFADAAGELLAQPSLHATRGAREATDHPPVHPVAGARKADLSGEAWRLYEIVVRRFLATLSAAAVWSRQEARIDVGGQPFIARGANLDTEGWRRYEGQAKTVALPDLSEGMALPLLAVELEERWTRPPRRYDQGELIEAMERAGLGTKSTRHEVVQKLLDRGYVEGRWLRPTDLGRVLVGALATHAPSLAAADMTARLEAAMEDVAAGRRTPESVVDESRALLEVAWRDLEAHREGVAEWLRGALVEPKSLGPCDRCGAPLVVKRARGGRRFASCSRFPECRGAKSLPPGFVVPAGRACDTCGSPLLRRPLARPEWICLGAECPVDETVSVACAQCGGDLRVEHTPEGGRSLACPTCNHRQALPRKGLLLPAEPCLVCGAGAVHVRPAAGRPRRVCGNRRCPTRARRRKAVPAAAA